MKTYSFPGAALNSRAIHSSPLHSASLWWVLEELCLYRWENRGTEMLSKVTEPAVCTQCICQVRKFHSLALNRSQTNHCSANISSSIPASMWLRAVPLGRNSVPRSISACLRDQGPAHTASWPVPKPALPAAVTLTLNFQGSFGRVDYYHTELCGIFYQGPTSETTLWTTWRQM